MRIRLTVPEEHVEPSVINAALEAVTRLDEHMIRSGQSPTSHELVDAGAKWHPEPPGDEFFDHGGTIAERGHGDCDDWAPLHAGTLRATGEDPGAEAIVIPTGPHMWHALVRRSDGSHDDPSVWAGMPAPGRMQVSGVGEVMQVYACDPHDGRIYQGALLPTTGPLSIHCGPQVAVRGIQVVGQGMHYQGRCDMPLSGSPLIGVRTRRRHHVVGSELPYAMSCTSVAPTPMLALSNAIVGAIMCGDAAEVAPNLDRYKLLAMQMGLSGHDPASVREAIEQMLAQDLDAAEAHTGIPGHAHADMLKAQLAAHGVHVNGYVGGFNLGDIGKIASGVVHLVSPVVNDVSKIVKPIVNVVPWGDIVHGAEAAVSVIPGLGTAVSDVIATGETAINAVDAVLSGSPLKFAVEAAYNYALASVPLAAGIRIILDPYVNRLLTVALNKSLVESGELDKMLKSVPETPKVGNVNPRSILASLAHLVVGHLGVKNTSGKPAAAPPVAVKPVAPAPAPVVKPAGVPHAAVHVDSPVPFSNVPHAPGIPAGATHTTTTPSAAFHWHCEPGPGGTYNCRWISNVSGRGAPPPPPTGGGMSAAARKGMTMAQRFPEMKPTGPTGRIQPDGTILPVGPAAPAAAPPGAPPGAPPPGGGGGDSGGGGGGDPAPAPVINIDPSLFQAPTAGDPGGDAPPDVSGYPY